MLTDQLNQNELHMYICESTQTDDCTGLNRNFLALQCLRGFIIMRSAHHYCLCHRFPNMKAVPRSPHALNMRRCRPQLNNYTYTEKACLHHRQRHQPTQPIKATKVQCSK